MDLTDAQWTRLAPIVPKPRTRPDGRGRPWRDPRDVLNGILWVMRTGAPWKDLPDRYPPYQTCHCRFQLWARSGAFARILHHLARELAAAGGLRLRGSLNQGDLRGREIGGAAVGLTRKGKGTKIMAIAGGAGLPLFVTVASANPAETALVDATLAASSSSRPTAGHGGTTSRTAAHSAGTGVTGRSNACSPGGRNSGGW